MSIFVLEGSNCTGKSTIAKIVGEKYNFESLKSVPEWFRKYIAFARTCPLDIQKEIYKIGHDANFYSCSIYKNYIMNRFVYSTIIRINYELHKSTEETVNEILKYNNIPTIIFVLKSNINDIQKRFNERKNMDFNYEFFCYENEIYDKLSEKSDIIYLIDNNEENIDYAIDNICSIIDSKIKTRKR